MSVADQAKRLSLWQRTEVELSTSSKNQSVISEYLFFYKNDIADVLKI